MELKKLRIAEKKIAILDNMGIHQAEDLLTYYPFRYEVIERPPREAWKKDDKVALEGVITSRARVIRFKGKQSVTRFRVLSDEEEIEVSLFNRPWASSFPQGKRITLIGRYDGGNRLTAMQYNFQPLQEQLGMYPIYTLREGITQKELRRYIGKAWELCHPYIEEFLPQPLREKYRLISRKEALYYIHHPTSQESVRQSLRHLKYDEFLRFQLSMQAIKDKEEQAVGGHAKRFANEDVWELAHTLPFALTEDQKQAIQDILDDLKSERVMYRMVQGDVGCGKTLVAAFGMYACTLSQKQAALMAPTEILAKQHAANLQRTFQDVPVVVEVLYSALKPTQKKNLLRRLKHHEIDILVGTHALFQEDVEFYDLGMVVADEQHRFGVAQRRKLLEKGDKVDFLLMSATPIPRTLALSLYGDMDVSTIQTLPVGRQPITTKLVASRSMAPILDFVLEKIDAGNQCYVVCPAIENNEEMSMRNVQDIYAGMQSALGKKYAVMLLHGRMSAQEKEEVMRDFVARKIDILVTTTVIEVGVDVPSANLMVIYDAHRFGLSQIHQLRGRIGRGQQPGYCFLLSDTKDADSRRRLEICEQVSDGFAIARYDLQLRGPGDILGTRQSGVPGFILGDVVADVNILEVAREDAAYILQHIEETAYVAVRAYLQNVLAHASYVD